MKQILKEYQVNFIKDKTKGFGDSFWEKANCLKDFCSPWKEDEISKIEFRAFYDFENFFFKFIVFDSEIYIDKTDDSFESIGNSDRVELFFRNNQELNPYYCLEMDTKARLMDFRAYPNKKFDMSWKWPKTDLRIKSSRDAFSFAVEGQISMKSLESLNLLKENVLEVGVFRAKFKKKDNLEYEPTWITWVDPKTESPNFHIASSFGKFILMK